jgi:sterol desaturase/sphingolipid hydroxylase (fatty acid hydroxylase superfamily)
MIGHLLNRFLDWVAAWPPLQAVGWLLAENVALFAASLLVGHLLVRVCARHPVTDPPGPLEWQEVALAAACVVVNTAITVAGWFLWRAGVIHVRRDIGPRAWLDALVLLLVMDALMYALHRVAHLPWVYPWMHHAHHRYDRPRPLNLFVLSPLEVLGFGSLWLIVLMVYPASFLGIGIYLALNLAFGTLGHLGVEPFPPSWSRWPILRALGSSTFHAGHHQDEHINFGFYTNFWDTLFGTSGTIPARAKQK